MNGPERRTVSTLPGVSPGHACDRRCNGRTCVCPPCECHRCAERRAAAKVGDWCPPWRVEAERIRLEQIHDREAARREAERWKGAGR